MTASVLNTKIGEVENKIPVVSDLVQRIDYDVKTSDIEKKDPINSDYVKVMSDILDAKIKQKEFVNKSDIPNRI